MKKRKYELVGEDWGLIVVSAFLHSGLEDVKVTKIRSPMERSRKSILSIADWLKTTSTAPRLQDEETILLGDGGRGVITTTPPPPLVKRKPFTENYSDNHDTNEKCTDAVSVGRAECVENNVYRSPELQAGLCVQQDEIGRAECVRVNGNCIEKETGGTVKVKSRVWTKLRNGTYAWRTMMITRKRTRVAEIVRTGSPSKPRGF